METSGGTWKYYTKLYEEIERPKETKRLWRPINGDTCNCKTVWRHRERLKEIKETVETNGNTYSYKIVWRDRD